MNPNFIKKTLEESLDGLQKNILSSSKFPKVAVLLFIMLFIYFCIVFLQIFFLIYDYQDLWITNQNIRKSNFMEIKLITLILKDYNYQMINRNMDSLNETFINLFQNFFKFFKGLSWIKIINVNDWQLKISADHSIIDGLLKC